MSAQMKTKEEFLERLYQGYQDGGPIFDGVRDGVLDGETFLIVENHETLVSLQALINGYEGDLDLAVVWGFQKLNDEMTKAIAQLEAAEKQGHYTGRYQKRIDQLSNLSAYLRWIDQNQIEEISLYSLGIETGFSDEYDRCCGAGNGCENIVRTSPDSYSWTPPLFVESEGYACDDCAPEFSDYVLEEFKNAQKSIPDQFDTDELGLVKINDESYENGFHYGMDHTPEPIIKKLNEADIDVWFKVHPSQFYIEFDVYVKSEDEARAKDILSGVNTYQGFSTAGNLEKSLRAASKAMGELPAGQGIKYATCKADGTAEARLVSPEEFIKGIKK